MSWESNPITEKMIRENIQSFVDEDHVQCLLDVIDEERAKNKLLTERISYLKEMYESQQI